MSDIRSSIRVVAFDLDGTLLETGPDLAAAANSALVQLGHRPQPQPVLIGFIGHGVANLVRRSLLVSLGREPQPHEVERATAIFRAVYREHLCVATRPYPTVLETLRVLRHRAIRTACITNKPEEFAKPLLERTGLSPHIEFLVAGDTLAKKKPDPEPLLHASAYFNVTPPQLLLVGDSEVDVAAARAAGSPVVVVEYGYSGGVPAARLGADAVIGGLDEITRFLQQ